MRPYVVTVALAAFVCSACAAGHTVTGRVVDSHGRPVADAWISITELPPDWIERQQKRGSQSFVMGLTEADGTFSLSSPYPMKYIEATSHDHNRRGVLSHVTRTNNVVVIR